VLNGQKESLNKRSRGIADIVEQPKGRENEAAIVVPQKSPNWNKLVRPIIKEKAKKRQSTVQRPANHQKKRREAGGSQGYLTGLPGLRYQGECFAPGKEELDRISGPAGSRKRGFICWGRKFGNTGHDYRNASSTSACQAKKTNDKRRSPGGALLISENGRGREHRPVSISVPINTRNAGRKK